MLYVNDIKLIIQKEPTLDFNENLNQNSFSKNKKILYFKKVVKPSDDEMDLHKKYLKQNLKKNYFN